MTRSARNAHRAVHCAAAVLALWLLGSCGGGSDGEDAPRHARRSNAVAQVERAQPARRRGAQLPIPPSAATKGMFSPMAGWPLIAIHAALLPDGRVMSYGTDGSGRQTGYFIYDLWVSSQPLDAGHLTLPNQTATDLFCSSQLLVMEGSTPRLLITARASSRCLRRCCTRSRAWPCRAGAGGVQPSSSPGNHSENAGT